MSNRRAWLTVWVSLLLLAPACGNSAQEDGSRPATRTPADPSPATRGEDGGTGLVLTPVAPPPPPAAPPPVPPRPPRAPKIAAPGVPAPAAAPAVQAPSPASPGTFLYSETGMTRIRGCLTLDQPPPSPTKLIVAPAQGGRQHLDRDQRDPLGSGSLTSLDLEYRPDGIYLSFLRQTQTSLLSSQPTEFQPSPPVLLLPAGATAGQGWSFSLTSRDGVKIDSQNRLEALDEQVRLTNGQAVATRRVLADSRITGQSSQGTLDLTRKMTTWYAPQNGLPVREVTDLQGRVGLCEVDSHIEATLQSL